MSTYSNAAAVRSAVETAGLTLSRLSRRRAAGLPRTPRAVAAGHHPCRARVKRTRRPGMMLLLALTQSGKRRFTSLEKGCERVLRVGRVALIEFSKVIPLRISQRLRAALEFP